MNEKKWTPGPWYYDGAIENVWGGAVTSGGRHIASGHGSDMEAAASAHLISAAPELYEALDNAVTLLNIHHPEYKEGLRALRKARGEK